MNDGHGDIWTYINKLRDDLDMAEERIRDLEGRHEELKDRVHDHEQAVPHAEASA